MIRMQKALFVFFLPLVFLTKLPAQVLKMTATTNSIGYYLEDLSTLSAQFSVQVKFSKKGAEGINLYSRLQGETNWNKLSFFAHSPCIDARPLTVANQAENREYMCIGVIKDKEIGLQSDIVSVAYAG